MAIIPVEHVPEYRKGPTQRDLAKADIKEAIEKGVSTFELEVH